MPSLGFTAIVYMEDVTGAEALNLIYTSIILFVKLHCNIFGLDFAENIVEPYASLWLIIAQ